jgi:uncharacterized protein (DUF488 family)
MQGFYTKGYGNLRPEQFLKNLSDKNVPLVIDVRFKPTAWCAAFTLHQDPRKGIRGLLAGVNIEYLWIKELGNQFKGNPNWADLYRLYLLEKGDQFIGRFRKISSPFCLLCAEIDPKMCHRRILSDFLVTKDFKLLGHL